jgi:hypothetical protein
MATLPPVKQRSGSPDREDPVQACGIPLRRTRPSQFWRWWAAVCTALGVVSVIGHLWLTVAGAAAGVVTSLVLDRDLRRQAERQPKA